MKVERISTLAGFQALREDWTALARGRAELSIFQSWAWQFLWWRHYGGERELHLLVARDGDAVVGIFSLYLVEEPSWAGMRLRLLRPVGTGGDTVPDYLGPILATGRELEVGSLLLGYLDSHASEWDSLLVSDLCEGQPFAEQLQLWARRRGWTHSGGISASISYIALPESWPAYLATLSSDRRGNLNRARRKLLGMPGARFFVWDDPASIDSAMGRLVELHHLRWTAKGESHSFSTDRYNRFHREVMQHCIEEGLLRLYCIAVGDEIIAMYYCYAWAGTIYYFQGGFDPRFDKLSPGMCLMGFAIEHAIGEQRSCFDMLRGEYAYKKHWARQTRATHYVLCHQHRLQAQLHSARTVHFPRLKSWVKARLGRR